jgi:hypothetical protein
MTTNLGFDIELPLAFNDAVARVKDALKQEGFGILTEIGCRRPSARSWVASSDPIRIAPRSRRRYHAPSMSSISPPTGTISGHQRPVLRLRNPHADVILGKTRRGEVAEWLKVLFCELQRSSALDGVGCGDAVLAAHRDTRGDSSLNRDQTGRASVCLHTAPTRLLESRRINQFAVILSTALRRVRSPAKCSSGHTGEARSQSSMTQHVC